MYIHHMGRLVRKQLYLTPEQNQRLRRAARNERRTEAEIVREALDLRLVLDEGAKAAGAGFEDDSLWEVVGMVRTGPADVSVQVDHYLYGTPRR